MIVNSIEEASNILKSIELSDFEIKEGYEAPTEELRSEVLSFIELLPKYAQFPQITWNDKVIGLVWLKEKGKLEVLFHNNGDTIWIFKQEKITISEKVNFKLTQLPKIILQIFEKLRDDLPELPTKDFSAIISGKHFCKVCGWQIVQCACNWTLEGELWDWWWYCSNKSCINHKGEGVFQNIPEWVFKS